MPELPTALPTGEECERLLEMKDYSSDSSELIIRKLVRAYMAAMDLLENNDPRDGWHHQRCLQCARREAAIRAYNGDPNA